MDTNESVTVEQSLETLSEAIGKAADDLCAARSAIDAARVDIGTRNTSVTRELVRDAERVIERLRETDECLNDVLKDLSDR